MGSSLKGTKGGQHKLARHSRYFSQGREFCLPCKVSAYSHKGPPPSLTSSKSGQNQSHLSRPSHFLPLASLCHKSHGTKATFNLSMSDFFSLQFSCYFLTKWNEMVGSHLLTVSRSVADNEQTDPQQKCMLETAHLARSLSAGSRPHNVPPGLLDDKLSIIK